MRPKTHGLRELEGKPCEERENAWVEEDTGAKKRTDRGERGERGKKGEWKQTGLQTEKGQTWNQNFVDTFCTWEVLDYK